MPGGTQDWFYHAPSKKNEEGAKEYPAASQIPAFGGGIPYNEWEADERDNDGTKRGWIRDSDTKYIQLCKKGGRKDLLKIRDPAPRAAEAKEYPRAEWFYEDVENNEENNNQGQYKSHLPDYMVYEEHHGGEPAEAHWQRPPFSLDDKMTAFERHGDNDKLNMKFPNDESKLRKPPKDKTASKDFKKRKPADRNAKSPAKSRHAKIPTPEAYKGTASIGKLLSNGYNQDWYENRDTHFKNHKPSPSDIQFETSTRADRQSTEYRDAINKNVKKPVGGGGGGGASYAKNAMEVRGTKKSEQAKELRTKQDEEKELFKLSKFDKVGSKVKSRWSETHERSSPITDTYGQQIELAPVSTN
eukprot:XP_011680606.1 PREDICTED: uncharacterized protein C7orf57 [Strongylocentrotus purpuratus]